MKVLLKAVSVVALAGAWVVPAMADDTTSSNTTVSSTSPSSDPVDPKDAKEQKDLKKVLEDQGINYVETAQKGITLSGYVDTSYTYGFAGAGEYGRDGNSGGQLNGAGLGGGADGAPPANTHAALRQFDTSSNTFNINAVKIALEKALPDQNEWAAGFRIDTIYGQDAKYLGDSGISGLGNTGNTSGLALEQALVKFRVPVGNGLDIYAGKFVTFLGYEVIESPANLNFSRGLLFTNLIPLTHTGVYADYKFNDIVEAKFGIVDGWNNSTSNSVSVDNTTGTYNGSHNDESSFGKALTGQLNINAPGKNANITQSFIYSPDGEPGVVGVDNGPLVVYDIWGNWNPTFVKDSKLLLGFNVDFGYNGASGYPEDPGFATDGVLNNGTPDSNTFFGVALYAQYKFSKTFDLAGRAEYIHSDEAANPKFGAGGFTNGAGDFIAGSQDDYAYTLTASFHMWDNLLTRVEYRIDDLSGNTTGTGHTDIQNEISLNAVYSF